MTDWQSRHQHFACLKALRNQQHNLEETIGWLVALMEILSEGESRDRLLDEISALDVIAEVMRRALDSIANPG